MSLALWLVWVLYFVVVEGVAMYRHRIKDTFSWQVWALERRLPVAKWAIAGGLIWLITHFFNV